MENNHNRLGICSRERRLLKLLKQIDKLNKKPKHYINYQIQFQKYLLTFTFTFTSQLCPLKLPTAFILSNLESMKENIMDEEELAVEYVKIF